MGTVLVHGRAMPRRIALACALALLACDESVPRLGDDAGSSSDAIPTDAGGADPDAPPADAAADAAIDAAIDAAPDLTPPSLVSVTPDSGAQIWLHEPVRFTFDEPLAATGATITARLGTAAVPATLALDGDRTIAVTLDDAARGLGTLQLTLDGVSDLAGNAIAAPVTAAHGVPAWSRPTIDRGVVTGAPAVAVSGDRVVAAWAAGGRAVVSAYDRGAWQPLGGTLGAADVASPALTFDAAEQPIAGWIDGGVAHVARFSGGAWRELASPGDGCSQLALARPPMGGSPVAVVGGSSLTVVALDATDAWQPLGAPLAITGTLVGEPAIAVPAAGTAVVAWIDQSGGVARLRAARFTAGSWTAYAPILLGAPPSIDRVSIAARGDTVAIAWDQLAGSFGVYAAKSTLSATAWTRLGRALDVDPAGHAQAPAIALDASGAPVVAWTELIETSQRGIVARWTGTAWSLVGGETFLAATTGAPSRPALALHAGGAPVVAWSQGGDLGVARFNGPRVAGTGIGARAPLTGCSFDPQNPPARVLQTGCFALAAAGKPAPHAGLVPFDVVVELWSDGTRKRRWLGLPGSTAMTTSSTGAWALPVGGFAVKEFAIETTPGNPATRRVVETRFLVRAADAYYGFSYQWRSDGRDADLLTDGQWTKAWSLDSGGTYTHVYPSRSHCLSCHERSWGPMLGVRPQQLARWNDYDGRIADQLDTLAAIAVGPASNAAPWISSHDASATDEQRTRSYMAANCAHCHNPDHIAIKDLRPTTPLAQTRLCEVITPGSPTDSIVYTKVTSRPGMPPLGTLITDPLIENTLGGWITSMTSCP